MKCSLFDSFGPQLKIYNVKNVASNSLEEDNGGLIIAI